MKKIIFVAQFFRNDPYFHDVVLYVVTALRESIPKFLHRKEIDQNTNFKVCYITQETSTLYQQSLIDSIEENGLCIDSNTCIIMLDQKCRGDVFDMIEEAEEKPYDIVELNVLDHDHMDNNVIEEKTNKLINYINNWINEKETKESKVVVAEQETCKDVVVPFTNDDKDFLYQQIGDNCKKLIKETQKFLSGAYKERPFIIKHPSNKMLDIHIYPDNMKLPNKDLVELNFTDAKNIASFISLVEGSIIKITDDESIEETTLKEQELKANGGNRKENEKRNDSVKKDNEVDEEQDD